MSKFKSYRSGLAHMRDNSESTKGGHTLLKKLGLTHNAGELGYARTSYGKKHWLEKWDSTKTCSIKGTIVTFHDMANKEDTRDLTYIARFIVVGPFLADGTTGLNSEWLKCRTEADMIAWMKKFSHDDFLCLVEQPESAKGVMTMIGSPTGWMKDPSDPWMTLKSGIAQLLKAKPPAYSWCFRGHKRVQLRQQALAVLKKAKWPLLKYERDAKFGESEFYGWQQGLVPALVAHYEDVESKLSSSKAELLRVAMQLTVDEVLEANRGRRVTPISVTHAFARLAEKTGLDTGSGWPFYKNSAKLTEDQWKVILHFAELAQSGEITTFIPAVPGQRSQEGRENEAGKYESKNRLILAASKASHIAAGSFIYPLQDILANMRPYIALRGQDAVESSGCIDFLLDNAQVCWSIDFTKFDTTLKTILPTFVKDFMSQLFDVEWKPFFIWYAEHHHICPIIIPEGIAFGEHGLMSGMLDTNCVANLLNRAIHIYTMLRAIDESGTISADGDRHEKIKETFSDFKADFHHFAMGDDTVLGLTNGSTPSKYLINTTLEDICGFHSELGLVSSTDRDKVHEFNFSDKTKVVSFLSRFYYKDETERLSGVPLVMKTLSKYWAPERTTFYDDLLDQIRLTTYDDWDDKIITQKIDPDKMICPEIHSAMLLTSFSRLDNFSTVPMDYLKAILPFFAVGTPSGLRPSAFSKDISILEQILDQLTGGTGYYRCREILDRGIENSPVWKALVNLEMSGQLPLEEEGYGTFCTTLDWLVDEADSQMAEMKAKRKKRIDGKIQIDDDGIVAILEEALKSGQIKASLLQSIMNAL